MKKGYDIPIDFCPKCKYKRIRVVMGFTYEAEFSLSGKCLRKYDRFPDTAYMLLRCPKCGWCSHSWGEGSIEDVEEYQELERIYLEANK